MKIHLYISALIALLLPAAGSSPLAGEDQTARTYYRQAVNLISEADTAAALQLLDRALEIDPRHWESCLQRGRLHLAAKDPGAAREDFTHALNSKSADIRCRAHIGLGDIYRSMPKRNLQAVAEYRLALQLAPSSLEALFAVSQACLGIKDPKGYHTASEALIKLLCLDPCFHDAYAVWRDTILDKTFDELLIVSDCIEKYIAENPAKSTWLFDMAGFRYQIEAIDKALENLSRLALARPEHRVVERLLLRARCLLELDEIAGFERSYFEAVKAAEKTGDFTRLVLDAEPIFDPIESKKAEECRTAEDWAVFFRKFWKRRDPDPISFNNERLVEHYRRLRKAEKFYPVFNPYPRRFNTSRDYYRLVSIKSGKSIRESSPYEYDPDLFWNRCRELGLGQRGLLYLRHGPADEIRRPEGDLSTEVWRYGSAFFPFEKVFGAGGEYLFVPLYIRGMGNINKAMETESFRDPLPSVHPEGYWTYFKGPGEKLEAEFYQSAPVETVPKAPDPRATLALYDSTWTELARDNSFSAEIKTPLGKHWIAVNRINSMPGRYFFALRMDIPGYRAVLRERLDLESFEDNALDLSGLILGSPAGRKTKVHSRKGVNLLPRPSLRFAHDEIITVYFEVYGLKAGRGGSRSYVERVSVTQVEEEKSKMADLLQKINPWNEKSLASLRLTFNRYPPENAGTVAEHFTIDTSELVPGSYSLLIEVLDTNGRESAMTGSVFDLTGK